MGAAPEKVWLSGRRPARWAQTAAWVYHMSGGTEGEASYRESSTSIIRASTVTIVAWETACSGMKQSPGSPSISSCWRAQRTSS